MRATLSNSNVPFLHASLHIPVNTNTIFVLLCYTIREKTNNDSTNSLLMLINCGRVTIHERVGIRCMYTYYRTVTYDTCRTKRMHVGTVSSGRTTPRARVQIPSR